MAVTQNWTSFDSGVYLLGGREAIPANALRVGTGTNPVHSHSMRSRNANSRLSTIPAISCARFAGHTYTLDTNGNVYEDFTIIKTGLTPGQRLIGAKAPPHVGAPSYLFAIGAGSAFKIDESGNITNWGIAAPPATETAQVFAGNAVFLNINQFTSLTGIQAYGGATLSLDTSNFIQGGGALKVVVNPLVTSGFAQAVSLNLNPMNSTDFDCIEFYVQMSNPQYVTGLTVQFDVKASNFTSSFYTVQVPIALFTGTQQLPGTNTGDNIDNAIASIYNSSIPPAQIGSIFTAQAAAQAQVWLATRFSRTTALTLGQLKPSLKPTQGALQNQLVNTITVSPAPGNWWLVRIPRGAFTGIGFNTSVNNWANVTGYRMFVTNRHTTDTFTMWFDQLVFGDPNVAGGGGGFGLLGNYSYYFTFTNSKSGSYSNPANNGIPLNIAHIDRNAVTLNNLPTSSPDPQVDTLTIWRTLGNGGFPYRLADITLPIAGGNFNTSFVDCNADYVGFGPNPQSTTNPLPNWGGQTTYAQGSIILPTVGNPGQYVFVALISGNKGSSQPAWPQFVGSTVVDGSQVWQNVGQTLVIGIEPLQLVNVLPPSTATACMFFGGTMFICGDTAAGARGRIYYSAVGYAEGVAGFTDISNDDDPTVGFGSFAGNAYVYTQRGCWLLVDVSTNNGLTPGWTAVYQENIPGAKPGAAYSIVSTPLGILYQSTNGPIIGYDGTLPSEVVPHLGQLFVGDGAEGYPAIGTIIAACFNEKEYWFSDGLGNTWAINLMPNSIPADAGAIASHTRAHGTPATALFYESDTGLVLAGWNGGTYHLETPSNYVADTGTNNLPFQMRGPSYYTGEKYTGKGQRLFVDINPGGNVIGVYVSIDGTDFLLSSFTGTSRQVFVFPYNMTGRLHGWNLISTGGFGQIEVFRVAIEEDTSGQDDIGTQGGPGSPNQSTAQSLLQAQNTSGTRSGR